MFIDEGAENSLIKSSTVRELCLKTKPLQQRFEIEGMGGVQQVTESATVKLCSLVSNDSLEIDCWIIDHIPSPRLNAPSEQVVQWADEQNVHLTDSDSTEREVEVLLAGDCAYAVVLDKRVHLSKWLQAIPTIFGWCIGRQETTETVKRKKRRLCNIAIQSNEDAMHQKLETMYSLETDEVERLNKNPLNEFEQYLHYKQQRFSTDLPWAASPENLVSGFSMAFQKLKLVIAKWTKKWNAG